MISFSSIMPSPLPSYCASASKPFFAVVPSASRVLSPKSSPPLSIVPLPFRSRQRKPSFFVQFIFSAKPFFQGQNLRRFPLFQRYSRRRRGRRSGGRIWYCWQLILLLLYSLNKFLLLFH